MKQLTVKQIDDHMKLIKLSEEHYILADDTRKEMYTVPISQAKEIIGVVDVEKKAWKYNPVKKLDAEFIRAAYICGYNEAVEDNKDKKYTEEDLKYMFECGRNYQNNAEITFKVSMEYIQPKTEWEVEFIDGKLRLKQ